jgi:VCBS repeat-containing protein
VLANDSDTDGDAIALAALNGGALGQQLHGNYGWLTLYSDGRYSYQSDGNARLLAHGVAQDKFTYAVTDTLGGTSTANLTVTTSAHGQAYFSGTPGQTISAGNAQGIVDGTLGDQTLSGGNGSDVLLGGPNDVLTGGNGADQFVFQYDFGHNEIKDFGQPDVIELQASTFGSIACIFAHYAVDDGHGNVLISDPHSAANTITVDHVSLSQLSANSFLLI